MTYTDLIQKNLNRPKNSRFIDLEQFINIQKPEIAYILGLIWADGHVAYDRVELVGIKSDIKHVSSNFLNIGNWSVKTKKTNRYKIKTQDVLLIRACNRYLAEFLLSNDYGSKSSKSADRILSLIPEHLQHYWFLGLFDGDGCLVINNAGKTKRHSYQLTISSNYSQNWTYMENLCKKLNIKYTIGRNKYINRHGKENSRSVFKINNFIGIKTFCEFIYKDSQTNNISFPRKFKKWNLVKDYIAKHPLKSTNAILSLNP